MKKSAITAFAVAGACLACLVADAAVTAQPPTPETPTTATTPATPATSVVNQKPNANFALAVNCTPPSPGQATDNLHFEIFVASRTGKFSLDATGSLEVFDSQQRILTCGVETQSNGKTLRYEFDLSPKYLNKSRFAFKCTGEDPNGNTSADVLWITLKDYAKLTP